MHITIDFRIIWVLVALGIVMMIASGEVVGCILPGEQWDGYGRWTEKARNERYWRGMARQWQVTLLRSLMIFLGLLQSESEKGAGRPTRDGRRPFVRQEQLASWFGEPQECISRCMGYWLKADWANLLSVKTAEWLTGDLRARIVSVFANFPQWSQEQVYQHLKHRGIQVTRPQVEKVAEQSGWQELQPQLLERYEMEGGAFHLRERWLISQLLAQVQHLLDLLEWGASPTPEERLTLEDLHTLAAMVGVLPQPALAAANRANSLRNMGNGAQRNYALHVLRIQ